MMFGTGDSFNYINCSKCGCLQIENIPTDINRYYNPPNSSKYYSFQQPKENKIIKSIITDRNKYCVLKQGLIGQIINYVYPNPFFSILGNMNLSKKSKILDVGSGSGYFLSLLQDIGFKNLLGIDPYKEESLIQNNLKIIKKNIFDLETHKKFDLIHFGHSFEHLNNQKGVLLKVNELLSNDGFCIIRMPIKTEYIWNRYGTHWVQIDAPRHFFIHTQQSFNILLKDTGLLKQNTVFDSTDFQFWGSEQYKRNIPLESKKSYLYYPENSFITPQQIRQYKKYAKMLNQQKMGDQATFIIKKK